MSPRPFALLCLLLSSSPLAAELTGGLRAGLGVGTAADFGEDFLLSAGVRAQLGAVYSGEHVYFGVARLQPLADPQLRDPVVGYSVGVGYERRFELHEGWRPTLGVTVGVGGAGFCNSEICHPFGPAAGLDLGLHHMLGERTHLSFSAELLTVVSAREGEGSMLLPSLWAGVGF